MTLKGCNGNNGKKYWEGIEYKARCNSDNEIFEEDSRTDFIQFYCQNGVLKLADGVLLTLEKSRITVNCANHNLLVGNKDSSIMEKTKELRCNSGFFESNSQKITDLSFNCVSSNQSEELDLPKASASTSRNYPELLYQNTETPLPPPITLGCKFGSSNPVSMKSVCFDLKTIFFFKQVNSTCINGNWKHKSCDLFFCNYDDNPDLNLEYLYFESWSCFSKESYEYFLIIYVPILTLVIFALLLHHRRCVFKNIKQMLLFL